MSNEINAAELLKKHEWMPNAGWTTQNIIDAMEEYAKLKTAQLEADKAELVEALRVANSWLNPEGRLKKSNDTLIQKHAAK